MEADNRFMQVQIPAVAVTLADGEMVGHRKRLPRELRTIYSSRGGLPIGLVGYEFQVHSPARADSPHSRDVRQAVGSAALVLRFHDRPPIPDPLSSALQRRQSQAGLAWAPV